MSVESGRFWASVTADLRNRGIRDILIACSDRLAGFEDAICSAFPATPVQRCVVHLVRNSLRPAARRDAAVAAGLRKVCTAPSEEAALEALAEFASSPLGRKYPQAVKVWEDAWGAFTPFLAFSPPAIKLLCTTNRSSPSTTSCARSPRPANAPHARPKPANEATTRTPR